MATRTAPDKKLNEMMGLLVSVKMFHNPLKKCMTLCAHKESPSNLIKTLASCFDFIFDTNVFLNPAAQAWSQPAENQGGKSGYSNQQSAVPEQRIMIQTSPW
jgi:hypothetical protein